MEGEAQKQCQEIYLVSDSMWFSFLDWSYSMAQVCFHEIKGQFIFAETCENRFIAALRENSSLLGFASGTSAAGC